MPDYKTNFKGLSHENHLKELYLYSLAYHCTMANRIEVYKALNDTYKDEALLELTGLAATH